MKVKKSKLVPFEFLMDKETKQTLQKYAKIKKMSFSKLMRKHLTASIETADFDLK